MPVNLSTNINVEFVIAAPTASEGHHNATKEFEISVHVATKSVVSDDANSTASRVHMLTNDELVRRVVHAQMRVTNGGIRIKMDNPLTINTDDIDEKLKQLRAQRGVGRFFVSLFVGGVSC